ncbi:hypothetical protein B5M47_00210 [candidate division CPR3 bacterium 4484_211]|uniref:TraG P-loop domain-containing protein n=1 Tax=candidate division CPR3 bacterium 4484_211 TaxID=1968527 RepID=A0A1W9NZN1_UNCC3|nr:MAG: hypothetical protein B5M47_00210 [candidate division CPR3 bacterium 4484_211]
MDWLQKHKLQQQQQQQQQNQQASLPPTPPPAPSPAAQQESALGEKAPNSQKQPQVAPAPEKPPSPGDGVGASSAKSVDVKKETANQKAEVGRQEKAEAKPEEQGLIQKIKNLLPFGPPKKSAALSQAEKFSQGLVNLRDIIAPSAIEIDFNHIQIDETLYRTYFVTTYPREVGANWLAPLINFSAALDISMFYYPVEAKDVLASLRRKITELETEVNIEYKEGRLLDPSIQLALQDAKELQEEIAAERERFFQFGLYITVPAKDKKELSLICHQLESILNSILIVPHKATLQMGDAFKATLPYFNDTLKVARNMDTTSIATTLPFTSSSLSSDKGIMYGINEHNGSLIIFDRFQMENANSVVFGTSGSGKSYLVKLEALRSLMLGTDIIVIDPENECQTLTEAIGGTYINLNFASGERINPFDLPQGYTEEKNELGIKILTLHSLFKIMLGDMSSSQDAILDKALLMTYRLKGITQNPETHSSEPPLLEDLYKVLVGMEENSARDLANRLEKYVTGSAKGLFDQHTNIDLDNTFIAFGIRDLPEEVRSVGMFLVLDYIWTRIRRDRKKRLLMVDEAWILMRHPDSAAFMHAIAKRGRKYYLGLTAIAQNIDDFLNSEEGKAIVTNSAIRILMKQSPSAINQLADVFFLSEGEKNLLLSCNIGEGIFFAGKSHVAMQVVASMDEHQLITTNPAELKAMQMEKETTP